MACQPELKLNDIKYLSLYTSSSFYQPGSVIRPGIAVRPIRLF